MHADFPIGFTLTTGAVGLGRDPEPCCGQRIAGWSAGLPITSPPTLAILGFDGDAFVAQAAAGALLTVVQ